MSRLIRKWSESIESDDIRLEEVENDGAKSIPFYFSFALVCSSLSLSNRRSIASFLSYTLEGNVKSAEPFPWLLFLPGGRCPSLTDRPSAIFPLDVFGSRLIKCV